MAKKRAALMRCEFHHFDYALAIVLGEVDALAVFGNAEAWLESSRVLVKHKNRGDSLRSKIVEIDCWARLGIGIALLAFCGITSETRRFDDPTSVGANPTL